MPADLKRCARCHEHLPHDSFGVRSSAPDGLHPYCKPCARAKDREWQASRSEKPPQERAAAKHPSGMKRCPRCTETLPLDAFGTNVAAHDGLGKQCKACRASSETNRRTRYKGRTPSEVEARRAELRTDGLKSCRACREMKPFEAFRQDRGRVDGLALLCTPCDDLRLERRDSDRMADHWRAVGVDPASCWYCGGAAVEMDHFVPLALGGEDVAKNLVPSCGPCNRSKAARRPSVLSRRPPTQDSASICEVRSGETRTFLALNHYLGKTNAGHLRYGWQINGRLVGVCTFNNGTRSMQEGVFGPELADRVLHLHRFAMVEGVASQFLSHAMRRLRRDRPDVWAVVTYADDSVGHVGTMYRASNFSFTGMGGNSIRFRRTDGSLVRPTELSSSQTEARAMARERGWTEETSRLHRFVRLQYPPERLARHGATLRWEVAVG